MQFKILEFSYIYCLTDQELWAQTLCAYLHHYGQLCYILIIDQLVFSNFGSQVDHLLQNILADRKVLHVSDLSSLSGDPVTEFKLPSDLFRAFQLSLPSQSLQQAPVREIGWVERA